MATTRTGRSIGTGAVAALLAFGAAAGGAGAVHEGDYPGHIHAGSCETLGDVVFPLGNAAVGGMMAGMMMGATPEAGDSGMGEEMGATTRVPVATSYTVVDAPLADILAGEHAINYHLSEDEIDVYIACGDIGGATMSVPGMDGEVLVIGLRSTDDAGISGIATLQGMGEQTGVTVFLAENLAGAEPAA